MKEECILGRAAEVKSMGILGQFINDGFARAGGSDVCAFGHPKTPREVVQFMTYVE